MVIDAPPAGGLQATAVVTALSTGTVIATAIQVINQGAGYSTAPNITFVNDPRDTTGSGAKYVTTLTATSQLTGLVVTNHGTPLTAVPTLAFTIGSCAATAVMNFTVTAYATASVTIGTSYVNAMMFSNTNLVAAQSSPAVVNPLHAGGITFPRPARIQAGISSGTILVAGSIVEDGGLGIQAVPNLVLSGMLTTATGTPAGGFTASVGGTTDTSYIQAI